MNHLSDDQEDHPNQQEDSRKMFDERGLPLLSLKESQWKLRDNNMIRIFQQKKSYCSANTKGGINK